MSERGGELIATDEPAIVTETLLDAVFMENGQSDGGLADSSSTNESEWSEVFCKADDPLD